MDKNLQIFQELGKVPPQAIELEEVILGAALLEKPAMIEAVSILQPKVFYKESHQKVFTAILSLFNKNEPVDLLTVTEELKKRGELEMVGGPYAVTMLTSRISTGANIEYHSRIVLQKYIKRRIINVTNELMKMAYEDTADTFEILNRSLSELSQLVNYTSKTKPDKLIDIIDQRIEQIKKIQSGDIDEIGLLCDIPSIDELILGFRSGNLYIIAARPSMGKTALMLSIARKMAMKGIPLAIFSLEMSKTQLGDRMISMESSLDNYLFKREKHINENHMAMIRISRNNLEHYQMFIDDTPGITITELRSKAWDLKIMYDIKAVFVDYLQLMHGDGMEKNANREREISSISQGLKALSKEMDIPVIALSQLSRAVETRGGDKRPKLSDLRESGSIEQDADVVAFLYRPVYYQIYDISIRNQDQQVVRLSEEQVKFYAELDIAKNRHGETNMAYLRFINKYVIFDDFWENVEYTEPELDYNSNEDDEENVF